MQRPTKRRMLVLGAATAAISAGAVAAPVFAQAATVPAHTSTTRPPGGTPLGRPPGGGPMGGAGALGGPTAYDAAVAKELGISTATFEKAEQSVRASIAPPAKGATGATATNPEAMQTALEAALAGKLGISTATLVNAEEAANQQLIISNLTTLVTDGALTQTQATALKAAAANGTFDAVLRAQDIARLTAQLNAAVAAGRLTRSQADTILADARTAPLTGPGLGLGLGCGPGMGGPPGARGASGPAGGPPPFGQPGHSGATGTTGGGMR